MSPVPNPRIYLKKAVEAHTHPVPHENLAYDEKETIDPENVKLNKGDLLIETVCVSMDPYFRGRMRSGGESYMDPYTVGEPITGPLIGKVIKSASDRFKEGQLVAPEFSSGPFLKYLQYNEATIPTEPLPDIKVSPSAFLGVLGMPGMTAWTGWKEFARAKKGETCFVTTGAGAVGSLVIQLAKLDGMRVIASAGSDEKVAYIKKLGADVAFNYKTTKTEDALKSFGKLDVYWDNVGGAQADAALGNMNNYGRIIVCGTASSYSEKPFGMTNWGQILVRRLQINGYLQGEIKHKHEELFWKTIPDKLVAGEIQFQESVYHGFSKAPEAFDDLMKGKNEGKVIVML